MRRWIWLIALGGLLSAATPEQVDRYLMLSGAEEQLIGLEQQFDMIGQIAQQNPSGQMSPLMADSQMLSLRFRAYLQEHISESEMDEIIAQYGKEISRKYVEQSLLTDKPESQADAQAFFAKFRTDPPDPHRVSAVKDLIKAQKTKELFSRFYEKMFKPILQAVAQKDPRAPAPDQMRKRFIDQIMMVTFAKEFYSLRTFSDEELQELTDLAKTSVSSHESRNLVDALIYALEEATTNMVAAIKAQKPAPKPLPTQPASTNTTTPRPAP